MAVLASARDPLGKLYIEQVERGARPMQIEIQPVLVQGTDDLAGAFASISRERAAAVIAQVSLPVHTVVELALEMRRAGPRSDRPWRVADLGTGSGAILLALLAESPDAYGVGTDISEAALRTASRNAVELGLAPRAGFVACDYAAALSGKFDLIVSNPPYIRSADIAGLSVEVRDYDPLGALDGGADGLDAYRALIPQAARLLAPGGALVVEAGQGQSGDIRELIDAAGLTSEWPPRADLAGIRRAVAGRKKPP